MFSLILVVVLICDIGVICVLKRGRYLSIYCCRSCNQRKGGRTPEEARMLLLYAPYIPNKAEYLILSNRSILADQMDFLAHQLPSQSRWRKA